MRRNALLIICLLLTTVFLVLPAAAQRRNSRSHRLMSRGSYTRGRVGAEVLNFAPIIVQHASEYGVDPALVAAVIRAESDGNPMAVSRTGAMGLMQLKQETCNDFGVSEPFDPDQNIRGGTALLAKDIQRYHGNIEKALAAYNAGPRRVDDGSWVHMAEPSHYVPRVIGYYNSLKGGQDIQSQQVPAAATRKSNPAPKPAPEPEHIAARSAGIPPSEVVDDGSK